MADMCVITSKSVLILIKKSRNMIRSRLPSVIDVSDFKAFFK